MIEAQEREDIIEEAVNRAVERALLMLPETVGHLITNHLAMTKMNKEFYDEHKEFKSHKDIVAAVVELTEAENPFDDYSELLKKALPKIKDRIKIIEGMDVENVDSNPKRDYNNGEI